MAGPGNARLAGYDFATLDKFLGDKESKKIGHNTEAYRGSDGSINIMYYRTTVVILHTSGAITVNSGGYMTNMTKGRINAFIKPAGYTLSQRNYEWFVNPVGQWSKADTLDFEDWMLLPVRH